MHDGRFPRSQGLQQQKGWFRASEPAPTVNFIKKKSFKPHCEGQEDACIPNTNCELVPPERSLITELCFPNFIWKLWEAKVSLQCVDLSWAIKALYARRRILNIILDLKGSQWREEQTYY